MIFCLRDVSSIGLGRKAKKEIRAGKKRVSRLEEGPRCDLQVS
jgi:hypothetical protein